MKLENSPSRQTLSDFLAGSLRIGSRTDLDAFMAEPGSAERVRSAPYQDLFLAIKAVGLADSQELLLLATSRQRRGFIDLDCWRKDSFHMASFMEWMAAYMQCGPEEAAAAARAVDPNLLALFLRNNIRIHFLEMDEPLPELPLILTPDQRFGIEVTGEAEGGAMARLLLDAIFRMDASLGYDLIDRMRWDNRVSMEEEAYQNKRRRLEEIGFVDYYEALSIYGEAGTSAAPQLQVDLQEEDEAHRVSSTLPALLVASLAPGEHLWRALGAIGDTRQAELISQQLAALANRILSVHSVTTGDLEKVKPALEEMRDTLNLGLERLTQGRATLAASALKQQDMLGLFRTGFSLLADLRAEADRVVHRGRLRLQGARRTLLESPQAELLDGLRRHRPLFFERAQDSRRAGYRNFRGLADVESTRRSLNEIEALGQIFWSLMVGPAPELTPEGLRQVNRDPDELRFGTLFVTAVLNQVRGKPFRPDPISVPQLQDVLRNLGPSGADPRHLADGLRAVARARLDSLGAATDRLEILNPFVESWCRDGAEELAPLRGQSKIIPQWVTTVLLSLSRET
ncbi:MAG: DUF6178 family protein [Acidobacteriota bacterium]|nr:DUF6178 family protein [Acidobacteriota bacterium]